MAIRAKVPMTRLYPCLSRATAARRQMAAADCARLQAAGPWTGGDGSAADRPLPLLPPLPQPAVDVDASVQLHGGEHEVERKPTARLQRVRDGVDACGGGSGRS